MRTTFSEAATFGALALTMQLSFALTNETFYAPGNPMWLGNYGNGDGTPDPYDLLPISYVILGKDAVAICRVIVDPLDDCPGIIVDPTTPKSVTIPEVKLRTVGDNTLPNAFPIKICEAKLYEVNQKEAWTDGLLKFDGIHHNVPITNNPQKYLVTGDTGLRVKPTNLGLGSCSNGQELYGIHQCMENFTQADLNETLVSGDFQSLDEWPLKVLMEKGAEMDPDVIIHVGDYFYRQGPCPESSGEDCVSINGPPNFSIDNLPDGTVANFLPANWGDTFFGWFADAIFPMLSVLQKAPMIALRGNHEICSRGGEGYFVLFSPEDYPENMLAGEFCPTYTAPYAVPFENEQILVIDDASINAYKFQDAGEEGSCPGAPEDGSTIIPNTLNRYEDSSQDKDPIAEQVERMRLDFEILKELSKNHETNFLASHRPLMGVYCADGEMYTLDWTMQQALEEDTLDRVAAVFSGHYHLLEVLEFEDDEQPVHLIVGHGSAKLYEDYTNQTVFPYLELEVGRDASIHGRVKRGMTSNTEHGFAVMERNATTGAYDFEFVQFNDAAHAFVDLDYPLSVQPRNKGGNQSRKNLRS